MKLLIDADFIVYKNCAACECEVDWGNDTILVQSFFSDAYRAVTRELDNIKLQFEFHSPELILFFSSPKNFRKKIYPEYKGHRNRKKPCGYVRVIEKLKAEYLVILMDELEADDSMGIHATLHPDECVICSPDKDMRQIPGQLFDMKETMRVSKESGRNWHYIQTLAGDQTDGYSGVPGIGVKRAVSLFEEKGYTWSTIVEAFEEKELTEEDALMNARLAKILTKDDYDFKRDEPILWTPTASD